MPRPRKCRRVAGEPLVRRFKPCGVPLSQLTEVYMPVEGVEALRLADVEGLSMDEAAMQMHVSRHTFGRILAEARGAVALAVVRGHSLRIEGGSYEVRNPLRQAGEDTGREVSMAKVAVTSQGPTLDDQVDPRFGRAGGFVVVDTETMEARYVDNGASQAMAHGAGIQAAERVSGTGAGVLLTGYVGPKAFQALQAAGIKICQNLDGMTVREAVEKYKAGAMKFADGPNHKRVE